MNVDIAIKSPKFNKDGTIDCEIEHPVFGWIPFTASPVDVEPIGRSIFQGIVDGAAGDIQPYQDDTETPAP